MEDLVASHVDAASSEGVSLCEPLSKFRRLRAASVKAAEPVTGAVATITAAIDATKPWVKRQPFVAAGRRSRARKARPAVGQVLATPSGHLALAAPSTKSESESAPNSELPSLLFIADLCFPAWATVKLSHILDVIDNSSELWLDLTDESFTDLWVVLYMILWQHRKEGKIDPIVISTTLDGAMIRVAMAKALKRDHELWLEMELLRLDALGHGVEMRQILADAQTELGIDICDAAGFRFRMKQAFEKLDPQRQVSNILTAHHKCNLYNCPGVKVNAS